MALNGEIIGPQEYVALAGQWHVTPWYLRLIGAPSYRRRIRWYLGNGQTHIETQWRL